MRFIEYQIVIGDAPPGLLSKELKQFADPSKHEVYEQTESVEKGKGYWDGGDIHRMSEESFVWTFSLIYKGGNFDVIKWKTSFAWKEQKAATSEKDKFLMKKDLFIGAVAGIFFLAIDDDIYDNFTRLADMMDTFLDKSSRAPFLVYGIIENKQKIMELKTNKDLLKNLADVKKWVSINGGEFKLENLREIKMNMQHLITEYTYFILSKFKGSIDYPRLKLGEIHYIDYEDLSALKEIEAGLAEQASMDETVDDLLSNMLFELLRRPEFQEEVYVPPPEPEAVEPVKVEVQLPPPSKLKQILREIRLGIRRQCPQCFNKERDKIFEEIDRDNIIMQNPNIYGFKYRCGMCGHEWRTKKFEFEDLEGS